MNFLRLKPFLELIKGFRKKKITQSATWQPLAMPRVGLMSARRQHGSQPHADVIMAVDDISIDLVNIDQVN